MKKLTTLLFTSTILFLISCGVDPLKYHDQIETAHEKLIQEQEKLEKVLNEATGKPDQKAVAVKQLDAFKTRINGLIDTVQKVEKLDDDAFKNAFIAYAKEMLQIANNEYKQAIEIGTLSDEQMTEEKEKKEQELIETINKKFQQLDNDLQKSQGEFAAKHNITLQ